MQDTPAAKLTYSAAITVPTPLIALMSAVPQNSPEASADGAATHTFKFKQEVPIPSYLLALAVGELEYRQIGPRSKVSYSHQQHSCTYMEHDHLAASATLTCAASGREAGLTLLYLWHTLW